MKPPLTVWTACALGGKTRRCIRTCLQDLEQTCIVLPSELQAQMARAILMAEGVSLDRAQRAARPLPVVALEVARAAQDIHLAPVPLRRWFLRLAIRAVAQPDSLLERTLQREGVLTILSAWAREMAREGVLPDDLEQLAPHSPEPEKIADLARLWRQYRRLLATQGWHEEEDVYLLAAQALREGLSDAPLPRRLLLDGFARFSRRETEFLQALAQAGREIVVTLCWEAGQESRFESTGATLQWLQHYFALQHQPLPHEPDEAVAPSIQHIAQWLFCPPSPAAPLHASPPAVEIWEAPHFLAEGEMVAREIVRLHREGMAWGEMAVLCRDLDSLLPNLEGILAQFNIPTQSFEARMLSDHPLTRAIINLLQLAESNYPRESVLQWLKSGYLPLDALEADHLRRLAVRRAVRSGADGWMRLANECERQENRAGRLLRMTIERTQALAQAQTPRGWLNTLREALSAMDFGGEGSAADAGDAEVLEQVMEVAHQVTTLLEDDPTGTPSEWARTVQQAWAVTPQHRQPSLSNAVWLLEAARSRPLRPRVVFIMGMQEGRFPRRVMEDPLLHDDDRRWLNEQAGCHLPLTADAAALERLAFYQAATCASQRVIFTYSRTEGDHDVQPSFYLRSLREVFPPNGIRQRSVRLSDIAAPLSHTVDERDTERTLVDSLFDLNPHTRQVMDESERLQTARLLHRWLTEQPERCQQWWRWRYLPDFPRLGAPPALAHRAYSATELEELRRCPFRHFVRWELKLRGERTHYAAGQGRWLHAVLCRRSRSPEQPLENLLSEVAQQHPVDRPLGEQHLLLQQLEEMVRSVLEREERVYSSFGLQTLWTEVSFGPAHDGEETSADAFPPLRLTLPNGKRMQVCGAIDRVDVCPQTGAAVLVDYKRDLDSKWWQNIQNGEDLQSVLYVAALRQVWKLSPAAVALDAALSAKRYRLLFIDAAAPEVLKRLGRQPHEDDGVVQRVSAERWKKIERQTAQGIQQLLQGLESGDITPIPGEHCSLCEYGSICRTVRIADTPFHDGEAYPNTL
jgi:ATP-dependent helicase/nuclease subunit B